MNSGSFSLSQSQLKIIAIITMTIDHIGYTLYDRMPYTFYTLCRSLGRTAFPIFAFMLVEGFFHTRDPKRHLFLLGLFAILSEIPFNLVLDSQVWDPSHQNVMITLFLGFAGMMLYSNLSGNDRYLVLLLPIVAEWLHTDYGAMGVLTIFCFYYVALRCPEGLHQAGPVEIGLACLPLLVHACLVWRTEAACLLALPPLTFYDGQRGRSFKYFFYIYYPAHLLVIALAKPCFM